MFGDRPKGFNSTLSRGRELNKVSPKRQVQEAERSALRDDWLERYPRCQIGQILKTHGHPAANRCEGKAIDVHETLKRSRKLGSFLDSRYFLSACRTCHEFTEREVAQSEEMGLLVHSWEPVSHVRVIS